MFAGKILVLYVILGSQWLVCNSAATWNVVVLMKSLFQNLIALAIFTSSFSVAQSALAEPKAAYNNTGYEFDNVIVFGDSLSDASSLDSSLNNPHGNNFWVKSTGVVGAPITSVAPSSKQRMIWVNYFIPMVAGRITPPENIFIYPSSQARKRKLSALHHHINYAWAGAETGNDYINDMSWDKRQAYPLYNNKACEQHGPGLITPHQSSCVPGVLVQVEQYLKDTQQKPNPKSLIIIMAGGNDIFDNMGKIYSKNKDANKALLLTKLLNAAYPVAQVGEISLSNPVKNIKRAVSKLIDAGVPNENIYVVNMPNLADTPAAVDMAKGSKAVLLTLTSISQIYNKALRVYLAFDYFDALHNIPNGHIISADNILMPMVNNPLAFGLTHTLVSCAKDNQLPYCRGYLFFNRKHPTSKAHEEIAKYLSQVI